MAVPIVMDYYVEFSTYTSKDTNLSLQHLIEYYEMKEYVVTISRCVFHNLNRSMRGMLYVYSLIILFNYRTAIKLYEQSH